MRRCECGCGQPIEHPRPQARYLNHAHQMRALRAEKPSQEGTSWRGVDRVALGYPSLMVQVTLSPDGERVPLLESQV
jgi:hypothetical protein